MEQSQFLHLIDRCRSGDRKAQETLVGETQNRVYYHCKKMLKNEDDALDATQDILITVITSLDKLKEPAAYWGWVNGITANRCKHLLSAPHREWQIPEDEEGNSMLDELENMDQQLVPEAALDNEETRRLVLELIDALPPEQKLCVLYYYYDEMTVAQIAEALNVPEGTVKSRLNYARKAIKTGAEDLERKGTKLYGFSPLPFLAYFLKLGANVDGLSPVAAKALTGTVLASGGAASTVGAATSGAAAAEGTKAAVAGTAKAATGIIGSKAALGLAGVVAAGAVAGGAYIATRPAEPTPPPTPTPIVEAVIAVPASAPTPTPDVTATVADVNEPEEFDIDVLPAPTPTPTPVPKQTRYYSSEYYEETANGHIHLLIEGGGIVVASGRLDFTDEYNNFVVVSADKQYVYPYTAGENFEIIIPAVCTDFYTEDPATLAIACCYMEMGEMLKLGPSCLGHTIGLTLRDGEQQLTFEK